MTKRHPGVVSAEDLAAIARLRPTVVLARSGDELTEEGFAGMLHNPIYIGIGPYPPLIDKPTWIAGARRMINEEGVEQFLVNMLHVLELSLKEE